MIGGVVTDEEGWEAKGGDDVVAGMGGTGFGGAADAAAAAAAAAVA